MRSEPVGYHKLLVLSNEQTVSGLTPFLRGLVERVTRGGLPIREVIRGAIRASGHNWPEAPDDLRPVEIRR